MAGHPAAVTGAERPHTLGNCVHSTGNIQQRVEAGAEVAPAQQRGAPQAPSPAAALECSPAAGSSRLAAVSPALLGAAAVFSWC